MTEKRRNSKQEVPSWINRRALARRKEELRDELDLIEDLERRLGIGEQHKPVNGGQAGRYSEMTICDAMLDILENEGAELHLKEIHRRLGEGGKVVGGKKPYGTLQATIRDYTGTFVNLGKNVWDLVERHRDQAGEQETEDLE